MGKSALRKDRIREIKNTKGRFLSILLIVAVGLGVFCGIKATAPSMIDSMEETFDQQSMFDYKLLSTVGFDEKDVKAVQEIEEVDKVQAAYSIDVLYQDQNSEAALKVMSLADGTEDEINVPLLTEGRFPANENECVVCQNNKLSQAIEIGQEISFKKEAGSTDVDSVLKQRTYKVVGFVTLPQYFSSSYDTCTIADGNISAVVMIPKSNFTYERYTEIYVTLKCHAEGVSAFSDEYTTITENVASQLTKIGESQFKLFIDEKQKQITDAEEELAKQESEAQAQFKSAEEELASAAELISEAEIELAEGEEQYAQASEQVRNELASARSQLDAGWNQYNTALDEYNTAYVAYQEGKAEYESSAAQFNEIKSLYNKALEIRDELQDQLDQGIYPYTLSEQTWQWIQETFELDDEVIEAYKSGLKMITAEQMKEFLTAANEVLSLCEEKIQEAQAELDEAKATLEAAEIEINKAKIQLDAALNELESGEQEFLSAKATAEAELYNAYLTLEYGKTSLDSAKDEYAAGVTAYQQAVEEAEALIADGKQRILSAKDSLTSVESGKWYILDRNDVVINYRYFKGDTNRIDAIAAVFPIFFLLVAILVCMSTMSRMVDEQRMNIGTYKALGYSKFEILMKYIVYGLLAGAGGVIIGPVIGMLIIPRVIANGYQLMYRIDDLSISIPWLPVIISSVIAIAGVIIVAYLSCRISLKQQAAVLMRPKAPKAGKKLFIEKMTHLWKAFTFFQKLTIRNIFRYKGRVIMTIVGITGCMSLMLSGFAFNDSVSPINDLEFGEIRHYDITAYLKESVQSDKGQTEVKTIKENGSINDAALFKLTSVEAFDKDAKNSLDYTYICVPDNLECFDQYITLRNPDTKEQETLNNHSVIVTKRLADKLNLEVGDQFYIDLSETKYQVQIGAIAEGYLLNYIYMTPQYYQEIFKEEALYNQIFAKANGELEDLSTIQQDIMDKDSNIASLNLVTDQQKNMDTLMSALKLVVLVVIICAGMLAFIVLYNLTNVNISERIREIATVKVLGFNAKEVNRYVFGENIVMTVIGIILGCFGGYLLGMFLINTVEVDMVSFGREVQWTSYVICAGLTLLFTLIINKIMSKKVKNIDMVESLKAVE